MPAKPERPTPIIFRKSFREPTNHGRIRRRADGDGLEIELLHLFVGDPQTGGYKCVLGDPGALVPLDDMNPPA